MKKIRDEYKDGQLVVTRRSLNVSAVLGWIGILVFGLLLSFGATSLATMQLVPLLLGLLVSGSLATMAGPLIRVDVVSMPWDIRPDCKAAYAALQPIANHLFQARKCLVFVSVPDAVRKVWTEQYGDDAVALINLLDGKVDLSTKLVSDDAQDEWIQPFQKSVRLDSGDMIGDDEHIDAQHLPSDTYAGLPPWTLSYDGRKALEDIQVYESRARQYALDVPVRVFFSTDRHAIVTSFVALKSIRHAEVLDWYASFYEVSLQNAKTVFAEYPDWPYDAFRDIGASPAIRVGHKPKDYARLKQLGVVVLSKY